MSPLVNPPIVTLSRLDSGRQRSYMLGEGNVNVTGYGGYEEKERPKRVGFAEWTHTPLLHLEIPLLIDNFIQGRSVQVELDFLEELAGVGAGRPPIIKVRPFNVHVPHDGKRWVVEDLDWDPDSTRRNRYGNVIRQAVTIHLMQYEDPDVVRIRKPKAKYKVTHKQENWHTVAKKNHVSMAALKKANPKLVKKQKGKRYFPVKTIITIP